MWVDEKDTYGARIGDKTKRERERQRETERERARRNIRYACTCTAEHVLFFLSVFRMSVNDSSGFINSSRSLSLSLFLSVSFPDPSFLPIRSR